MHVESGRRYVGLTSQTMAKRWKTHVSHAKTAKGGRWHFPNAIRKYGKEAFSHHVLEFDIPTLEIANEREEYWIEFYGTRNPERGFNLARGGEHKPHGIRKNPWKDPEYRAKQVPRLIAATHTPQARANNKAALNTPESREKRSAISKEVQSRPRVRAKNSAANKAIANTPQGFAQRSAIMKGKKLSPERAALERARLDMIRSSSDPKVRKKISSSLTGYKQSAEHVANAVAKRWEEHRKRTYKICKIHGRVAFSDCIVRQKPGENPYRICGLCRREYLKQKRVDRACSHVPRYHGD
jgi:group I intron endonuclease